MTIPLWLPWAVLLGLTMVALPRPDSWLRLWGPAAVALVVALWLTVDHYWITQGELAEATTGGASVVDGSMGGVAQDRLRIEVEDRLGRPVRLLNAAMDTGEDSTDVSYGFTVTSSDSEGGPAMCVSVVESRVDTSVPSVTLARVSTASGACE